MLNKNKIRITFNGFPSINKNDGFINKDKDYNTIVFIYILGLFFSSVGMFFAFMSRLGYWYLIFELLYWGYLVKNNNNKFLNKLFIFVYVIYIFSLELISNGSGIFPYYINFI